MHKIIHLFQYLCGIAELWICFYHSDGNTKKT